MITVAQRGARRFLRLASHHQAKLIPTKTATRNAAYGINYFALENPQCVSTPKIRLRGDGFTLDKSAVYTRAALVS